MTAVDSDSGDDAMLPSPFCHELARWPPNANPTSTRRFRHRGCWRLPRWSAGCARWSVPHPERSTTRHVYVPQHNWRGSRQADVPGADPQHWYGMRPLSTDAPLWSGDDQVVTLSPSTLQTLADCPLRWLLERHGGTDGRDVRSAIGSLLHALVADPAKTEGQMLSELENLWAKLPFDSQWYSDNELARHRAMLSTFAQWRAQTRHELTEVGTEVDVDGVVGQHEGALPGVRVRGRLDRLERDGAAGWWWSTSRPARARSARTTRNAMPSWRCTSWPSPKGCCRRATSPAAPGWSISARPVAGGATEREQDALTPERPRRVARTGAARRGRHPGPAVHRPCQRRLRPLPGAGQLSRPGRQVRRAMTAALQSRPNWPPRSACSHPPTSRPRSSPRRPGRSW